MTIADLKAATEMDTNIKRRKQGLPCDCWRCQHIAEHPETSRPLSREELLSFLWRRLFDERL